MNLVTTVIRYTLYRNAWYTSESLYQDEGPWNSKKHRKPIRVSFSLMHYVPLDVSPLAFNYEVRHLNGISSCIAKFRNVSRALTGHFD